MLVFNDLSWHNPITWYQLKQFFSAHSADLTSGFRSVKQAIESATNNVCWMHCSYNKVFDWLKTQNANSANFG